jgi:hypothetical protein
MLYLLFAEGAERIVGKEGIAYENVDFWSNKLLPFLKQRVWVAETADMGRLCVFTADRRKFICFADNAECCGRDRREMALLARQAQARFIREGRKAIGSARKRITAQVVADATNEIANRAAASPTLRLVHDEAHPERATLAVASRALEDAAADLSSATMGAGVRSDLEDLHERNWARYQRLRKKPTSEWSDGDHEFVAVYTNSVSFRVEMQHRQEKSA